ncbi:Toll-like receptor Tollo [Gryllus bimaculatus]|nr:Toll-like receptor Tollo [Gryllus bimaculatus]
MFSANFAVHAFVITFVAAPLSKLVRAAPPTYEYELLESYRLCLADDRGGIYWLEQDVPGISCKYIWTNGTQEVFCEYTNGGDYVRTTYQLDPNVTFPPPRRANCDLARWVLIRAPRRYLDWRYWVSRTSPVRITLEQVSFSRGLPSLSDFGSLWSFSLTRSPEFFHANNTSVLAELPSTVEEISFARNNLNTVDFFNSVTFPSLKRLDLSHNILTYHQNFDLLTTAAPFLEELDLSHNALLSVGNPLWKLCVQLNRLDVSFNRISGSSWSFNPQNYTTSLKFLNISHYKGYRSQQRFFTFGFAFPHLQTLDVSYSKPEDKRNIWKLSGPKLKNLYASGYDNVQIVGKENLEYVRMKMVNGSFPILINCSIKQLDLSNSKIRLISNLGLNNTTVKYLDLSMNEISQWTTENIFEIGEPWVNHVNFSHNKIHFMSPSMLLSLQALTTLDLRENPLECNNCTIYYFQTWLKKYTEKFFSLNNSYLAPHCGSPIEKRHVLILDDDYYQQKCFSNTPLLTGSSLGGVCLLLIAQGFVFYYFRQKIIFIYHMYRLRIRQSSEDPKNCTHDVFICYSSSDRAFVMNILAPFIEDGPEKYKAYIHERAFTLGCNIDTNIVEAIEKSRRSLLVVSQAFLASEVNGYNQHDMLFQFCKKEYDMVTHRAFESNHAYMVILRFGPLSKESLPRPLRLYMSTKTYLEWPDDPSQLDALEVRKRLVKALGRSIYEQEQKQTCQEQTKEMHQPEKNEATHRLTECISYRSQDPLYT